MAKLTLALQDAVNMVSPDDPDNAKDLDSYALCFHDKWEETGDMECIEAAIDTMKKAIYATQENDLYRVKRLSTLGRFLKDKFIETEEVSDIEEAISYAQQAFELTTIHPDRSVYLCELGICYQEKFKITDDLADINIAIAYLEDLITTYPRDQNVPARVTHSLGSMFGDRFQNTGKIEDVDKAIQYAQIAWDTLSLDDLDYGQFSNDLGSLFGDRFEGTGDNNSLEDAIKYVYMAIDHTDEGHPSRSIRLNNLGSLLLYRYQRFSCLDDLQNAINFAEQSVLKSTTHPWRPIFLSNLANLLRERFQREKDGEDIDAAVRWAREAVSGITKDHPDFANRMNNLGLLLRLQSKGEAVQNKDRLEEAIQCILKAVNASSEDDPNLTMRQNNLALLRADKFLLTKAPSELDEAIKLSEMSVAGTPKNHPDLTMLQSNLGDLFHDRFLLTGSKGDLRRSTASLKKALDQAHGIPLARVSAGYAAAQQLGEEQKWDQAARVFDLTLKLFPNITPLSNSRDDLQHTLRELWGIASLASSVYIKAGRPPIEVLQALEQGRGVVAGLMMDFRSDLSDLKDKHPEVEARYGKLRQKIVDIQQVKGPAFQEVSAPNYALRDAERHRLFLQLHEIETEVRGLSGFERFLLPPSKNEVLRLAQDGPLVSFNISEISSEAVLITTAGIEVLALPDLNNKSVQECVDTCASRGGPTRDASLSLKKKDDATGNPDVSISLQNLWRIAVKPVLARLNLLSHEKQVLRPPHIRWIGGGVMSVVPLHAAGDHSPECTENTLHHVVSSYVPTLKFLQFVQKRPLRTTNHKILVVTMPTTPGHPDHLNVEEEVVGIKKHTKSWATTTVLEHPSKTDVLRNFMDCTIVHFACHGIADSVEPAKSSLLLGKEFQERLTLGDLDMEHNDGAKIAYLSACSTAQMKAHDLIDESAHLATAFQLSGFQHAIGTLWGARDSAAVAVATSFYKYLAQDQHDGNMDVAYALHHAVKDLRNASYGGNVLQWAPFIHVGF